VVLTPALLLAVFQSEPKTSPPPVLDAVFEAGRPSEATDVDDVYDGVTPPMGVEAVDVGVA